MNKLRQSLRRRKPAYVPEASRPHQWQADEDAVRKGTCSFPVRVSGRGVGGGRRRGLCACWGRAQGTGGRGPVLCVRDIVSSKSCETCRGGRLESFRLGVKNQYIFLYQENTPWGTSCQGQPVLWELTISKGHWKVIKIL